MKGKLTIEEVNLNGFGIVQFCNPGEEETKECGPLSPDGCIPCPEGCHPCGPGCPPD